MSAIATIFASESAGEQGYNWTDRFSVDLENGKIYRQGT